MSGVAPEICRVAERALLVRFADADLARAVSRAHALAAVLRHDVADGRSLTAPGSLARDRVSGRGERQNGSQDERLSVKGEWILGAGSLLVRLDDSCSGRDVDALGTRLEEVLRVFPFNESSFSGRSHSLEVTFGHESGKDLEAVAREVGLDADEVAARFCAATYTVAFVGFSPGFPYLIGLPPELEVPRLAEPRTRVPAGSVAIAGPFAGVYPSATPGGWRLLGRADAPLFDLAADPPALLVPGDRVRFIPS